MVKLLKVLVDDKPVRPGLGHTVMQTCAQAGVEIPRFCYHDKLLIAGNCRICLVEILGSKKLVASCAVHVLDNMVIFTNTVRVRLARQHVLEFLLANHPLDCPICDQGGECDLQDIASVFGADRGRFYEFEKRAVLNKDFGPLIRTSMNRCIHCTRCVRFLSYTSGLSVLGTLGRGVSTEISLYVNSFISDELSGNITDLCPVGALTSKPYSFQARPWELVSVSGVDVFDTLNANLSVDIFANKISRILPYANEQINECWLSNRARYAYDGLFVQRLSVCLLKIKFKLLTSASTARLVSVSEFYIKLTWDSAVSLFFSKLLSGTTSQFSTAIGGLLDLESVVGAKTFLDNIGVAPILDIETEGRISDFTFLYFFNTSVVKLTRLPTFCLLVGANLRLEAPVLNLRLNNLVSGFGVPVYRIGGAPVFLSFKTKYLSNNLKSFFDIMEFKHEFCKNFYISAFYQVPFILIGRGALLTFHEAAFVETMLSFFSILGKLAVTVTLNNIKTWDFSFFGFIYSYSGRLHAYEVGFLSDSLLPLSRTLLQTPGLKPVSDIATSIIYSLGFDSVGLQELITRSSNFNNWIVYQGTHGHGIAGLADLILPSFTHVESSVFYKNLIGLVTKTGTALSYNFESKPNIEIFKLFTNYVYHASFKFAKLNFRLSVRFNWNLLVNHEILLSSRFLLPWRRIFDVGPTESGFCSIWPYTNVYRAFLKKHDIADFWGVYAAFYKCLLMREGRYRTGHILLTTGCTNYYSDPSITLLTASKTMNLCSNFIIKKNLSIPVIYF